MRMFFLALALLLATGAAWATTNSAQICTDATKAGQAAQACINSLKWDIPKPADLVLTRPPTSTEQWGTTTTWQTFGSLIAPIQYRTCPLDLSLPALHGNVNGTYVGDQCGSSQVWVTSPTLPGGQSVTVQCTEPTQNTNGTAIAPNQKPLQYYFYENLGPTGPLNLYRSVSPPQPGCNYVWQNMEQGIHYYQVVTGDALGAVSGGSNVATKTVTDQTPNSPQNLTTGPTTMTVYAVKTSKNKVAVTVSVGTVPANTPCDTTQPVIDKFVVPREAVSWFGLTRPQAVVASCMP